MWKKELGKIFEIACSASALCYFARRSWKRQSRGTRNLDSDREEIKLPDATWLI
jgi:hypothetical protein